MKKKELVTKLVNKINDKHCTVEMASKIVNEVFNIISDALEKGDSYSQDKFGTFKVVKKAKRKGRNLNTGEEMMIPEKSAPKWIVSTYLKNKVSK